MLGNRLARVLSLGGPIVLMKHFAATTDLLCWVQSFLTIYLYLCLKLRSSTVRYCIMKHEIVLQM